MSPAQKCSLHAPEKIFFIREHKNAQCTFRGNNSMSDMYLLLRHKISLCSPRKMRPKNFTKQKLTNNSFGLYDSRTHQPHPGELWWDFLHDSAHNVAFKTTEKNQSSNGVGVHTKPFLSRSETLQRSAQSNSSQSKKLTYGYIAPCNPIFAQYTQRA